MKYFEKICCFFIFAKVFVHMCPSEKFEKYLNALIEWIAFCLFLLPFVSGEVFFNNRESWETRWQEQMDISFEDAVEELEEKSREATEKATQDAVEEARKAMEDGDREGEGEKDEVD